MASTPTPPAPHMNDASELPRTRQGDDPSVSAKTVTGHLLGGAVLIINTGNP